MRLLIVWLLVLTCTYLSTTSAQGQAVGLIENHPEAQTGYTLFTPAGRTHSYMIDNNGFMVHSWEADRPQAYSAYLLENGNLLRQSTYGTLLYGGFQEMAWDGEVVWEYQYFGNHHDIEPLPNGNVLLITEEFISEGEAIASGRIPANIGKNDQLFSFNLLKSYAGLPSDKYLWMLRIIEVQQTGQNDGEIVWEWHLRDHLIQDYDETKAGYGMISNHPGLIDINYVSSPNPDWVHANSIDYNKELDLLMISSANFSEIWVIDHSTSIDEAAAHSGGRYGKGGDILYRWGNPQAYDRGTGEDQQLFGQHDAQWIEAGLPGEGNILIFNNRSENKMYSSLIEINPPMNIYITQPVSQTAYLPQEPVWGFESHPPDEFFSFVSGGVQRLPNGNTLVCDSVSGTFFEVTSNGSKVWEYVNPIPNEFVSKGETGWNGVFKCRKYDSNYPGLAVKNLAPAGTLETYQSTFRLTINDTAGGSVTEPGTGTHTYGRGQTATLVAKPLPFHQFSEWVVGSGSICIHHPDQLWTTFTMGTENTQILARFENRVPRIALRLMLLTLSSMGIF